MRARGFLALLVLLFPVSVAAQVPPPDQPGPFGVGHLEFQIVDATRADRPLDLRVWYPVDPVDYLGAPTEYPVFAAITIAADLAIDGLPVAAGEHPLIVFSHGSGGLNLQSTSLCETLASHGFIVAAPNHTGNTTDDFQNGTAVSLFQSAFDRPADVSFVIDEMLARSEALGDTFEGRVRDEGIGVAGHSFGGFTSWAMRGGFQGIEPDLRVSALMPIAPATLQSDAELREVDVPVMLLSGTLDTTTPIDPNTTRPFMFVRGELWRADIVGAGHIHFANVVCDIGNALIQNGLPEAVWMAIGAGALITPWNDTCVPGVFPLAESERIQNLYGISFFKLTLMNETGYDDFLTAGYAANNEPDVLFFDPAPPAACGFGFELAFVIAPIALWRRSRGRSRRA